MPVSITPGANRLLAQLPPDILRDWRAQLEPVDMPLGQVLFDGSALPSHVWFPATAIVCPLIVLNNGDTAAMAVIGREGLVGLSALVSDRAMPSRAVVQCAGSGFRLRADVARQAFDSSAPFRQLVLRHLHALMTQVAQNAVCNRHHSVTQQLCRWLLHTLDRLTGADLEMTHELLAQILGVRREGVTMAAFKLQAAGVIRYARGHIAVLDRAGLEHGACECYATIANEYARAPGVAGLAGRSTMGPREPQPAAQADAGSANRHHGALRPDKAVHHRQADTAARAIQARGAPRLHDRLEDVWTGECRQAEPVV
jgi:CRP-like cAMP-binding protein